MNRFNEMQDWFIRRLLKNRGAPRLYFQGRRFESVGFRPGAQYTLTAESDRLVLEIRKDGSHTVCKKDVGSSVVPVIDINSARWLKVFEGAEEVRVILAEGRITITLLAVSQRVNERLNRLSERIKLNEPVQIGSLNHGGGVLTHAIHRGLVDAGIGCSLTFANDIREDLLEQASKSNDAWSSGTRMLQGPMQELAFDFAALQRIPKVDLMELGLPCDAASLAGRAKKGLAMPEDDERVGHLVVSALSLIAWFNPAIVLLENVPMWAKSSSASIYRTQMKELGYELHETVIEAQEFNVLEHRKRLVIVAVTRGMEFDFATLVKPERKALTVAGILEPVADEDQSWSRMEGLKAKMERDIANGKGFRMQVVAPEADRIPTLTKGLQKNRSTDPKFPHPTDPDLLRIPLPSEHARAKGISTDLITGLCKTVAHELLGQSICWPPFYEIAKQLLARALRLGKVHSAPLMQADPQPIQDGLFA